MRIYFPPLFFILILAFLSEQTNASEYASTGIEVSGEGSITVLPNNFSLSLMIKERGRVTSKLKASVDKKSNLVIKAAQSLGVKTTDISSARVSLRAIYEKPSITVQGVEVKQKFPNSNNKQPKRGSVYIDGNEIPTDKYQQNKQQLFELTRRITVNFTNIDDYDLFLTKIVKVNVNHISSLVMTVNESEKYYQQALIIAIAQAKNKASEIAKQAGVELGNLVYLKEISSNHYQPRYSQMMMADYSENSHSSLVGSSKIKASVLVKFAIED